MREIPPEHLALYAGSVVAAIGITIGLRYLPRLKNPPIWVHPLYAFVTAVVCRVFIPDWVQDELFSPGGVVLVGTILPVWSSIVAICSVDSDDDESWLQFWVSWGTLSFLTEFMDNITEHLPAAGEHWFEFEFFIVLWLALPFTNGAAVLHKYVTKPFLAPVAGKLAVKMEGWIQVLLSLVNTSYIWGVWYFFVMLPEEQRRFIVVSIGTVYPLAASIVTLCVKSEQDKPDEKTKTRKEITNESIAVTKWLTYWCSYMLLFIIMDYLENFVGHIRGFYTLCACATLYLGLPLFDGAEVVLRRVLVPLSGQYEQLLLRDAWLVKESMVASIPATNQNTVLARAAALFTGSEINEKKDS